MSGKYKVEVPIKLGSRVLNVSFVADSELEIFKKASFLMSDIPQVGPNGETDLRLLYRRTQDGDYDYYSIVSDKAGQEFQFGQSKKNPGQLFPKGWVKLYKKGQDGGNTPPPTPAATKTEDNPSPTAQAQADADDLLSELDVEI